MLLYIQKNHLQKSEVFYEIFTDTNSEIKKAIFTIKTESKDYPRHYKSPEEDVKSETRKEYKYQK